MRRDPKASYDGITKITAGVQSAVAPIALPRNQLAWAVNIDCRTDFVRPRPGWVKRPLTFLGADGAESPVVAALFEDAIYQGAIVFERFSQIVAMIGGVYFASTQVRGASLTSRRSGTLTPPTATAPGFVKPSRG